MNNRAISKRQFIKYCAAGICGLACGLRPVDLLAYGDESYLDLKPAIGDIGKWSKEALFYTKTADGLQCLKCPHGCLLGEDQSGRCRSRVNRKGKMYSIAYGNPCAVHIDPIEKKPLSHFLPTTRAFSVAVAGCTFACLNCQNWQVSQFSPTETKNYDLMPTKLVEKCLSTRCESIAYTYSEPTTFYEYAYDTAKIARSHNIRNVWKSCGFINEEPIRKLAKYLDASNIDLKSLDDNIYAKLNSGRLEPVLRTLKILKEEGVWLEITNLVIPTWTDDLDLIKRMCDYLYKNGFSDCPLHFSRFSPLHKLTQLPKTPVSTLEKAREIAMKSGIKYAYIGNVPGHDGAHTYCHKCNKMIVERRGHSIIKNDIVNGKCRFCNEKIPGVWT
jgi:pyruvate formate lyase activating enzyme